MPKKTDVGLGEASQARHQMVAPSVVVRFANRGLGYERDPRSEARLHQTEPPNALPASERCPGQPSAWWEILSLGIRSSLSVMAATSPSMCGHCNFISIGSNPGFSWLNATAAASWSSACRSGNRGGGRNLLNTPDCNTPPPRSPGRRPSSDCAGNKMSGPRGENLIPSAGPAGWDRRR